MDEATSDVPKAWWRSTTPFRGRGPEREVVLEGSAGATVAELLTAAEHPLGAIFGDGRSDGDLVRAGELYLGVGGGLLRVRGRR